MYIVNNGEYKLNDLDDVKDFLEKNVLDWFNDEEFDEFLDEDYDDIQILGVSYDMSHVLKNVDELFYEIAKNEYIKEIIKDYIDTLENYDEVNVRDKYKITKE